MAQNNFSQVAKKSYDLGDDGRALVRTDLQRFLNISDDDCDVIIDDIELTGGFRTFGYGSLITDPASEMDEKYAGKANGWEKGAFCKDRHYRGTPDKLGVAMGALPTEGGDGSLPGIVDEISADEHSGRDFTSRICNNIRDFSKREVSLNPIYEHKIIDIETNNRGTVKAMICAVDPESPLYLGRDGEEGGLTMEEKAAIIATSIGVQDETNTSPRTTGMAYWRDHVKCCELGGFEPDEKIQRVIELAELYRAELKTSDPELFEQLTTIEAKNAPPSSAPGVTYATPVYNVTVISASEDPRTLMQLRDDAIVRADLLTDPLNEVQLAHFSAMLKELNTPTVH
ncbi:MAG: hypothetical protein COA45_01445 [Zetaproteobacteria bacterium]|nr:MAG: hypothetical protein COA45_01445 [Zetaproteobacteria bacterium]